jgi:hypothetical protein
MFMRPVKPKCTLRPIAASTNAAVVGEIAVCRMLVRSPVQKSMMYS